jgi:hypothetical protein
MAQGGGTPRTCRLPSLHVSGPPQKTNQVCRARCLSRARRQERLPPRSTSRGAPRGRRHWVWTGAGTWPAPADAWRARYKIDRSGWRYLASGEVPYTYHAIPT